VTARSASAVSPALATAGALLAGVLLAQRLPALPPAWVACIAIVAILLAAWRWPRWRWWAVLAFGLVWAALHGRWALDLQLPQADSGRVMQVQGRVLGLPQQHEDGVHFHLRVEGGDALARSLQGRRLRVGWYGPGARVHAGEHLALSVTVKRARGVLNPGGFDAEKRTLEQRVAANAYVRDGKSVRRMAPPRGIDAWRQRLSGRIDASLPDGRGRFVQALALGDTRGLQDADWDLLRATGLTHLIAISGFHVGLVAGFGALLARCLYYGLPMLGRRWPRPQAMALAGLLFALGYTALAGFALPTLRTSLMIAVIALARMRRRASSGAQCFALALAAVLLFDPLAVLAPGFWLSFVGVAWLLWCLPQERGAGIVRPFLKSQAVAVVGLLPLTVWFFGMASLLGPLTNLLGIPWISLVVVPLALLGLLCSLFSPTLAAGCWHSSAWLMEMFWRGLQWLGQSPAALAWLPEPNLAALLLAMLGAFWLLLPRGVPGKPLAFLLLLPLLWPRLDLPARGEVDIALVDVGQGLSVLVLTENHVLLYDAGPAGLRGMDYGESAVVPALRALGVRKLDAMVLSHGDNDHAGGAKAVLRAFPRARVLAPEVWAGEGMSPCLREDGWEWDGVRFRILHPPPLFPYLRNESSCVLRIEAGGRVALLPGDIGRHVEARLVKEQAGALRADLLVAPHHGSDSSSSGDFMQAVRPGVVLLANAAENRFRLPKADVVARYRQQGADLAGTAESGWMRLRLAPEGLRWIERRRQDRARYWRVAAPPEASSGYAIAGKQVRDEG
jgi:competence protein ComEC